MKMIDGTVTIGEVKAGSRIVSFRDLTVIVHPDDPPKYIDINGLCIRDLPMDLVKEFNSPSAIHPVIG